MKPSSSGGRSIYDAALRATLRNTAAAYGYTLTLSATVAMLMSVRGSPTEGQLFLLVGGGVGSFAALEVGLAAGHASEGGVADDTFPFAGALNFVSVAGALGAATGIAHVFHSSLAWLFAPMAATAVYLLLVAVQVAIVEAVRAR